MKNFSASIFAIDFEGSKKSGVVEFGVAELAPDGRICLAETSICSPKAALSARESSITGIDSAEASSFAPFEAHLQFFATLRLRGVFAAHNAAVEDNFLRSYAPVLGFVPNFFSGGRCNTWAPWLDSLVLSRLVGVDSPKLSSAAEALGVLEELQSLSCNLCPEGRRKWHCALYDAIASLLIIKKILSMPEFENISLSSLGALCGIKESGQASFL